MHDQQAPVNAGSGPARADGDHAHADDGHVHAGASHAPGAPQPGWAYPGWPEPVVDSRLNRIVAAIWTRPAWLAPLAILVCMASAATYVLTNNPTDDQRDALGPCLFRYYTGLDCPGCGGTRMMWYVLHGNIPEAAHHHVMALVALPVVLWAYIAWAARRVFSVTLPTRHISFVVWGGFLVAWLGFSVLRNLPWEPFLYFRV